jgi:hypothetical protein
MAVADGCPCGCGCQVCHAQSDEADETATEPSPAFETPAETAAETTTSEETAMAEPTTPAETPPGTPETGIDALGAKIDKLSDALAGFITAMTPKPAESTPAPAEPVAEQAPAAPASAVPVAETDEQRIARLVADGVKAALPLAVQETVERYGPPTRKGLVRPVAEAAAPAAGGGAGVYGLPEDWPDKPLHTYTKDERAQYLEPLVVQTFLGDRANRG